MTLLINTSKIFLLNYLVLSSCDQILHNVLEINKPDFVCNVML